MEITMTLLRKGIYDQSVITSSLLALAFLLMQNVRVTNFLPDREIFLETLEKEKYD